MQKKGVEAEMLRWRPYKSRKRGQSQAPWDISALVTYICVAITEFLLKPAYRKVCSCEVRYPLKLTPLLVKGKMGQGPSSFHVTVSRPLPPLAHVFCHLDLPPQPVNVLQLLTSLMQ